MIAKHVAIEIFKQYYANIFNIVSNLKHKGVIGHVY